MRTVITDTNVLHALSSGVVYNPFDKRLHAVGCASIGRMRASSANPKWHFSAAAEAATYLAGHHARWGGAMWQPATCCLGDKGSASASQPEQRPTTSTATTLPAARSGLEPLVRRSEDGFEVWSDEYVRNESRSSSPAGALRRLISGEIRRLPAPAGRLLHAAYAGDRWHRSDIENLLFNNIDQTLYLFALAGVHGLRFEDLGHATPVAPDGSTRSSYYAYRTSKTDDAFVGVQVGEVACRIPDVIVPDGSARLAARIWLALRRARPTTCAEVPLPDPYMLRVKTRGLPPATTLKAIIDGASAAMQRGMPTEQIRISVQRLESLLGVPGDELLPLVTAHGAPLGEAMQPFVIDGSDQVRVTPDDERCIAAEVVAVDGEPPPRLAVDLHRVSRQGRITSDV